MGFFDTHKPLLDRALRAIEERGYWEAYPEAPSRKIYGETAKEDGEAAFRARLGGRFALDGHPSNGKTAGKEVSPYGMALDIAYPTADINALVAASREAGKGWAQAGPETRVGICLEILHRLNRHSFEMANAVMHTTGQPFVMAFQAGGPHAQERGLEAVAYAWREMTRTPAHVTWTKPQGKHDPIVLEKEYRVIPRGLALVVGCATFPTWNSYPGLFASLATGNTVIVKPHPTAILPLALAVETARAVIADAGLDPNAVLLAVDEPGAEITKALATNEAVAIVDFTGSSAFGEWLRENARQAQVYTEEAGLNSIVVTGTDSFKAMCANIAFSLSLYSGQMCTAPQNVYVPRDGIGTDEGHKGFDEVADGIAGAVDKLLGDPARAAGICGALAAPATLERVGACAKLGTLARASAPIEGLDEARTATPLIVKLDGANAHDHEEERFGPISFVIAADDAHDCIRRASEGARRKGALTAAIYATDEALIDEAADAFAAAGVVLSCNLTGGIFVNQNAAFSDYHVTGANPAGNACLTDAAFVANRFRISAIRRPRAA
ncbi:phenylacetic acid degradation protein PaaN [Kaustia mangrovi]|uniref:Phenylacetic acid degradation protein PaaN n=1 Tax=Kaustia mangrovi TaxID=2593653 RepID=A0A7S8C6G1_9HYPH|nr:phenylacetic acid degradation protein PaaN [Kaustia mangrovi]QPC44196.1 phenylacetic acid degradation protein PaaN [Kaustia mangrovi]